MARPLHPRYGSAWVTGAGAGLGRAIAGTLVAEGLAVVGTSRDPEACDPLPGMVIERLDFSEPDGLEAFLRRMRDRGTGAPDILINNAGSGVYGRIGEVPAAVMREQLEVLLTGPMLLCRAVFPDMVRAGRGCVVNISSLAVDFPMPHMHAYNAGKGGLSAFSHGLALEASGTGVRVVDFRPGDLRTRFNTVTRKFGVGGDASLRRCWERVDAHLQSAPAPQTAARQLLRVLRGRGSGTYTAGSFFQARLGMLAIRLFGRCWIRPFLRRYYRL